MTDRQTQRETTIVRMNFLRENDTHIAVRLDKIPEFEIKQYIDFLKESEKELNVVIIAEESAPETGKLHWHGYLSWFSLEYNTRKLDTMQKAFRRRFKHRKNQYSMTYVKDVFSYLPYICKGKDIIYKKGINDEAIQELGTLWISDEVYEKTDKKRNKITDIYKAFMEEHNGKKEHSLDVYKLFVINYFISHNILFNEFQVISYIKSLYALVDKKGFVKMEMERLEKCF